MATEETEKRVKKLEKVIEGTIVKITEGVTGTEMLFDFSDLPEGIQEKLGPFGLGHKLGDAAAGKEGEEAVTSIKKVWDGLAKGDWSVRAPAAEKITKKGLADNLAKMPAEEAAAIRASLAKLGIKL